LIAWLAVAWAQTGVWVAAPTFPGPVLERVVRQAERQGAVVVPVAKGVRCLTFDEVPDERWMARAGRRLGVPLEARADCAVARYPVGQGWYAAVLGSDVRLEERVDSALDGLSMSVLAQPLDGRSASLCVSALQVSVDQLSARLSTAGLAVEGIYEVGSCSSRLHQ
jgi:hypothetical protein